MATKSRVAQGLTGLGFLAIAPFGVMQGLLLLEHGSPWHSQNVELLFVIAALTSGAVGVWLLPIRRLFTGLLLVPYIAVMMVAVWVSGLPAVCTYFGDCL